MFGISVTLLTCVQGACPIFCTAVDLLLAEPGSQHCRLITLHMLAAAPTYKAVHMWVTWPGLGFRVGRPTVSVCCSCSWQSCMHCIQRWPQAERAQSQEACAAEGNSVGRTSNSQHRPNARPEKVPGGAPSKCPWRRAQERWELSVGRGLLWAQCVQQETQVYGSQRLKTFLGWRVYNALRLRGAALRAQ